ncbi:MAG: 50S ribosomal protein L4 [candidate division Zixibacteria bacterium]|nr:50S ribosomal protein L4 [candidate division Zixibacteria bacterium]
MTQAPVFDITAKEVAKVSLKKEVFGLSERKDSVVHEYVVAYLANQRHGTHSTLNRANASGGGKKPWRQKGTGRARAGTNVSPVWVGGARAFGPKPDRDYSIKVPKKVKRLALKAALSDKAAEKKIMILDEIKLEHPKTKTMADCFQKIGLNNQKVLLVHEGKDEMLVKSARNMRNVAIQRANLVNPYSVVNADVLLLTRKAHKVMEEVFSG